MNKNYSSKTHTISRTNS